MARDDRHCRYTQKESGAALIVALVMLLLMAIIGVTAMQGVTLQEKMTGNMRDNQTALFAGEIALDYAESWVDSEVNPPDSTSYDDCSGCDVIGTAVSDDNPTEVGLLGGDTAYTAWKNRAKTFGNNVLGNIAATDIDGLTAQPEFLLEFMLPSSSVDPEDYFDGTGIDTSSVSCTKPDTFNTGEGVTKYDYCYRITAEALGASDQGKVILQTEYIKRYN